MSDDVPIVYISAAMPPEHRSLLLAEWSGKVVTVDSATIIAKLKDKARSGAINMLVLSRGAGRRVGVSTGIVCADNVRKLLADRMS